MKPFFLFAPGAGAPSSHPWMQHWVQLLKKLGPVQTLDYSYMKEGGKRPDPLPKLITAHCEALDGVDSSHRDSVVLIGKSLGSRIGCHVAVTKPVSALVCLGYPLCGSGDPSKLRDRVLLELHTPILFVQGTRDKLCPVDLLESVRQKMSAPNKLHIVRDGDHSLTVTKRALKSQSECQDDVDQRILESISDFVTGC